MIPYDCRHVKCDHYYITNKEIRTHCNIRAHVGDEDCLMTEVMKEQERKFAVVDIKRLLEDQNIILASIADALREIASK